MKQYGLIGRTLSHSFSKNYFDSKFRKEGKIDSCSYELYELQHINDFKTLIETHPLLHGLNVTIPYKEQIIPFLDKLEGAAPEIGAVNTIKIERNLQGVVKKLTGFNTDAIAFLETLRPLLNNKHTGAILLGTGGASKAVTWALRQLKLPFILISRSQLAGNFTYSDIDSEMIKKYPVIINASPVGMYPNVGEAPVIPYELLTPENLLYDLVYNPAESLFMKNGMKRGATVCNGAEMLKIQAEEAWKIWNEQ